ncbi:CDP-diacylglycerol pyrophosphatase [Arsenophonus endosymbiont of Aleurodicus floccissimus]|uniref:CDP-diacylglycerol diphosphatase n=1 Tax=Arsenophonus endosymbiont of Aleurodicus floccissimus TaxID=2152761 RepID=UPI000EF05C61|nr:CDP-diacylglycerol diphosphatase [Arsenophonus endosymbiont of Aleurodicus floccissimus]SPP31183.1 CDP-diacylglycerol pyrophosphatase [Arsenophonus endosymbiont of Aleurodicus floccissimus]
MKKTIKLLLKIFFALLLSILIYFAYLKINSDKLWQTINQQCIPEFKNGSLQSPCIKVDQQHRYVIYKDIKGPLHDLLLPLDKISGIESPILQQKNTENYFMLAWKNRQLFIKTANKPINEQFLSLVINSKYGRSQEQLHIHLACLKAEMYQIIKENEHTITTSWQLLKQKINSHRYIAIKIPATNVNKISPFHYLEKYAAEQGDNIAYYGLAMIPSTQKSEFILLASRLKLLDFNLGSTGAIQDYQCKLSDN